MAEAVARKLASDIIEPSSAGLYPFGCLAGHTEQTLLANGYSVAELSSKSLRREALESADLIINMSGQPLDLLLAHINSTDPPLADKIENWCIEDPYGASPATYQKILEELESRVLSLADRLRSGQPATRATNS
jgi:protein-tyrosine-phosphatase